MPVGAVERFVIRTGPYRSWPDIETEPDEIADMPDADQPVAEAWCFVNSFSTCDQRAFVVTRASRSSTSPSDTSPPSDLTKRPVNASTVSVIALPPG